MISSFKSWPIFVAAAVIFAIHLPVDEAAAQRRGGRGGSGWEFVAKNMTLIKTEKSQLKSTRAAKRASRASTKTATVCSIKATGKAEVDVAADLEKLQSLVTQHLTFR